MEMGRGCEKVKLELAFLQGCGRKKKKVWKKRGEEFEIVTMPWLWFSEKFLLLLQSCKIDFYPWGYEPAGTSTMRPLYHLSTATLYGTTSPFAACGNSIFTLNSSSFYGKYCETKCQTRNRSISKIREIIVFCCIFYLTSAIFLCFSIPPRFSPLPSAIFSALFLPFHLSLFFLITHSSFSPAFFFHDCSLPRTVNALV